MKFPDIIWLTEDPNSNIDGGPVYWCEDQITENDQRYISEDVFFSILEMLHTEIVAEVGRIFRAEDRE